MLDSIQYGQVTGLDPAWRLCVHKHNCIVYDSRLNRQVKPVGLIVVQVLVNPTVGFTKTSTKDVSGHICTSPCENLQVKVFGAFYGGPSPLGSGTSRAETLPSRTLQ